MFNFDLPVLETNRH